MMGALRRVRSRLRKLTRASVLFLPKAWRLELFRRSMRFLEAYPQDLKVMVAESREDLEIAFRILHDEYVRYGFMKPHPSGLRVTPYHALPSTTTLVAKWRGEVVGTVSLIRSSSFGFPLSKIFDISKHNRHGVRLAEVSALAIRRDFQGNHGMVLFPLIKFVVTYAFEYFGVDKLVICVNPNRIEFYESLFFFERLSAQTVDKYDFVNGAPAVGAYVDKRRMYRQTMIHFGNRPPRRNLFHFLYDARLDNLIFPDRVHFKINDPIMTPDMLDYFFNIRTQTFADLDERQRIVINSLYDLDRYQHVLPPTPKREELNLYRRQIRHDVDIEGRILLGPERQVRIRIFNVSRNGFSARLDSHIRFGDRVTILAAISDFTIADLKGWPVWRDDGQTYGFQIDSYSDNWLRYVRSLDSELNLQSVESCTLGQNGSRVAIAGHLGSKAHLESITPLPTLSFDLGGITSVDRSGVEHWRDLLSRLKETRRLDVVNCPISVITMFRSVPNTWDPRLNLVSVRIILTCPDCQAAEARIVDVDDIQFDALGNLRLEDTPPPQCDRCHIKLVPDMISQEDLAGIVRNGV